MHSLLRQINNCTIHAVCKSVDTRPKKVCTPMCTYLTELPLKHSDVWTNYRWTSYVHVHKDMSEPVCSLKAFIKHWQFSSIIITGSEKTWLNRIESEFSGGENTERKKEEEEEEKSASVLEEAMEQSGEEDETQNLLLWNINHTKYNLVTEGPECVCVKESEQTSSRLDCHIQRQSHKSSKLHLFHH